MSITFFTSAIIYPRVFFKKRLNLCSKVFKEKYSKCNPFNANYLNNHAYKDINIDKYKKAYQAENAAVHIFVCILLGQCAIYIVISILI